ncbi:MAG: type II toxin-antitoxin system VapC family toxin [Methylobacter sp.]|nr:type II toxin-antitoxin system VapC family toxin [Methylobacter sp.]MDP2098177.1 type II toxin-antitoxin system VapC family toxin [Methylobacter sp.]MDP2426939.1 type II toxin-antitoxin system VapC family toxin [Methylobacter sp.]MDP3054316.1 type II toxin-antitoxin system VapC family toxin [Methylobacter sp.]MDP3364053.1 type II toxin-antitoxin system VapC family toxin [Methylobacter sp.]
MVVDSSVLIAILLNEDDAAQYAQKLINADQLFISAVSIVEASMVIEYKKGETGAAKFDELLQLIEPTIIAFDKQQAQLARIAWRNYGKGRHPAKLNFGDCCSYAAAQHCHMPLLFKGNDFSQTDIQSAL